MVTLTSTSITIERVTGNVRQVRRLTGMDMLWAEAITSVNPSAPDQPAWAVRIHLAVEPKTVDINLWEDNGQGDRWRNSNVGALRALEDIGAIIRQASNNTPAGSLINISQAQCWNFDDPTYGLTLEQRTDCLYVKYIDCAGVTQQVPYPADRDVPIVDASACSGSPVQVRTTDGLTNIDSAAPGSNYDQRTTVIPYRDAADAPQVAGPYNTDFDDATNLNPNVEVPRRELFDDTPAPLGLYVTLDDLLNNTVPQVPAASAPVRAITASWGAGDADTLPILLPAEYQGITYDFVSQVGTNGTITVSVNNGGSFAAPPFTVGASEVIFRRTTTTNAGSALYEE